MLQASNLPAHRFAKVREGSEIGRWRVRIRRPCSRERGTQSLYVHNITVTVYSSTFLKRHLFCWHHRGGPMVSDPKAVASTTDAEAIRKNKIDWSSRTLTSVAETVGNTPLVRLRNISVARRSEILMKLEWYGPSGSLKDWIYLHMFQKAEGSRRVTSWSDGGRMLHSGC
jgi:hypothetical protein